MRVLFIINDLGINEPFGPMILSAILKQHGHETALAVIQKGDVERRIQSFRPDVLAYSMMSVDLPAMQTFNDDLRKRHSIFTILGGPHCTLDHLIADDPNIDAICVGEGDQALLEVVERLKRRESVEGVANILTSSKGSLTMNPLVADLNSLPAMDRELIYPYPEMASFGIKGIWASRGCIFPCPYCFNNRINHLQHGLGRTVRRRSVDSMVSEMKKLKKEYRVDFVRIQDDVFAYAADEWLTEFADKWSREIGLPFYCLLRSELVTEKIVSLLKKAGCKSICMSIESSDDDIRVRMMRRKVSKQELETAFHLFKKYKINVYANTMLALPYTNLETDIANVDFAIQVKPEMPNFSIFMPYPGTDLGDYCRDTGVYDPKKDTIEYGMRNMSPLLCFTDRVRRAQYNLCQLAIVAIKLPFLRGVIVNRLIYWRPNAIFFAFHYLFAVTSYGRKIFPYRHSVQEYFELFWRTLKHYLFDFTQPDAKPGATKVPARPSAGVDLSEEKRRSELERCCQAMEGTGQRAYSLVRTMRTL